MSVPKAKFEISAKDKTRATLKKLKSRIDKVRGSVFSLKSGFVGLAGAAGLGVLINKSNESADVLAKNADMLGETTFALAGLQHAANLTGVEQASLTKSLIKQQKAIADADRGLVTYSQHFDALGLSTTELMKLSPVEQFSAIAEELNKVENQTKKTAIAYDLFGGKGVKLLNTMALGKDGLAAAAVEADVLGLAISRIDAAKIEIANDSVTRAKAVFAGLGLALSSALAPFVDDLAKGLVDTAKKSGGMANFVSKGMLKIINSMSSVANAIRGLKVSWLGLQVVAVGAIAGILTAVDELEKAGRKAADFFPDEGVFSWIPTVKIVKFVADLNEKPKPNISNWAETSRLVLLDLQDQMKSLAMQEMPGENIKAWAADIIFENQKVAESIAKTKSAIVNDDPAAGGTPPASDDDAARRQSERLLKSVNAVEQSLLTEDQRKSESILRQQQMVSNAFAQGLIDQESRDSILLGLADRHEAQKTAIAQKAENDRRGIMAAGLGAAANIFSSLGSLMGRAGKKQNAMQKVLARAGIIASTAQAVMNALAVPPYPLGVSLAVGAALQGATQLRAVGGSGGGSIPSPVSSSASQQNQSLPIPHQQSSAAAQEIKISIDWADATPDQIDQMADSLAQNMANGGRSPIAA